MPAIFRCAVFLFLRLFIRSTVRFLVFGNFYDLSFCMDRKKYTRISTTISNAYKWIESKTSEYIAMSQQFYFKYSPNCSWTSQFQHSSHCDSISLEDISAVGILFQNRISFDEFLFSRKCPYSICVNPAKWWIFNSPFRNRKCLIGLFRFWNIRQSSKFKLISNVGFLNSQFKIRNTNSFCIDWPFGTSSNCFVSFNSNLFPTIKLLIRSWHFCEIMN